MPICNASHLPSPIVVAIVYKDPLIRLGVAATLNTDPGFVVHFGHEVRADDPGPVRLGAVIGVDVVIADYDSALAIASALKKSVWPRQAPVTKIMIVSERDGEAEVRFALEQGIQGYLPLGCGADEMADGVVALHRGQRRLGQSVAQRVAESFGHEALTSREIEVLRLVVAGHANKMVAKTLDIALGTVKVHVRSIMSKLGARTRTEAAAVARRRGLFGRESEPIDAADAGSSGSRQRSETWRPFERGMASDFLRVALQ